MERSWRLNNQAFTACVTLGMPSARQAPIVSKQLVFRRHQQGNKEGSSCHQTETRLREPTQSLDISCSSSVTSR
ncbi:hypothetical protein BDZ91DRAFT_718494 [Kalaharituber pfeilii]|nr:hypothetical protein BDZ91DRAFT_718494 [Kalaharituber pfeilii]